MERKRITNRLKLAVNDNKTEKKALSKGDLSREIEGFEYDKSKAKILKDVLHNINVSLGTLISAMKQLSMLRGSDVTPDGKIGGKGFVMLFKDIKRDINESVSALSDITDSLGDELKNPKWGLKDSEIKKIKKEQDKVEEIEEIVEDLSNDEESNKVEESKDEDITLEDETKKESNAIEPNDVKDSKVLERYRDLLGSECKDKVASLLSKSIIANMVCNK